MLIRIMILTLLLAAACTPSLPQESAAPQDSLESTQEVLRDPTATSLPVEEGLQKKFTQLVTDDLATRLSIEIKGINFISAEAIVWPNAALGCPTPGKAYAQGAIPGFRIRLEAENKEYSYHTDRKGRFVLCAAEQPALEDFPELPALPGEIDNGQPGVPAD